MEHTTTAPDREFIDAHGIFVRFPGEKRGAWLTPKYTRNDRRVHAALARTAEELEKFERVAAKLREENPDAHVEVRKL
jgi:hypothetical protein